MRLNYDDEKMLTQIAKHCKNYATTELWPSMNVLIIDLLTETENPLEITKRIIQILDAGEEAETVIEKINLLKTI